MVPSSCLGDLRNTLLTRIVCLDGILSRGEEISCLMFFSSPVPHHVEKGPVSSVEVNYASQPRLAVPPPLPTRLGDSRHVSERTPAADLRSNALSDRGRQVLCVESGAIRQHCVAHSRSGQTAACQARHRVALSGTVSASRTDAASDTTGRHAIPSGTWR